jgi:hypothetical protein
MFELSTRMARGGYGRRQTESPARPEKDVVGGGKPPVDAEAVERRKGKGK